MWRGVKLSSVHMMHFQGDLPFCLPPLQKKVLCGFSEWRTASGFSGAGKCPWTDFSFLLFFLIFLFYFFILSTEWGIWTLTPNCERPGNWWAKIHNRLILYIYMYKSPWTQWRISKTVYKGILIMRVNKHDLKIKLIWSLIFWSLSSQRGLRPSDKIWGA